MNILITGGNGYVAKSLYESLKNKYNITTTTRQTFDLSSYDVTCDWFNERHFDVVLHTAIAGGSRLQEDDSAVLQQNLAMYNNLRANRPHFKRLISFGSGAELHHGYTPYANSKREIADSIENTEEFYNLRIFGVFDHNELNTRFIKSNIIRYLKKEPIIIHANKIMDFIYMDDLISLVDKYILESNLPKTINCSYESKLTLREIANHINNLDDFRVPIIIENKKDLEFYCGNAHDIDYNEVGLVTGIQHTYRKLKQGLM